MTEAIALMRDAFVLLSEGRVNAPVRTSVPLTEHDDGRALFMPVYSPSHGRTCLKAVIVHPNNDARGLPFIHALVLVSDATTGAPLAIIDGEALTALRTGAGAGLATDVLARQDATVVAIFGAGVQARTQLEAVCAVRSIHTAYVFGRRQGRAQAFAHEMTERLGIDVRVATSAPQLRECDIICTATTSLSPVFAHRDVKTGCHINGVGSYRPDMTEIPADTVRTSVVVVDQREACLEEAGDIILPIREGIITEDHIHGELGEVVAGQRPGRTSDTEITFFKSVGNAVQDLVVASRLADLAEAHDWGLQARL